MSVQTTTPSPPVDLDRWPRRLALTLLLLLGAALAYLPFSFYPYTPEALRPLLWGGITVGLLTHRPAGPAQ